MNEFGDLYGIPKGVKRSAIDSEFSAEELSVIDRVVDKLGRKSAKELRDLTHTEKAWKETEYARMISYEYAKELKGI